MSINPTRTVCSFLDLTNITAITCKIINDALEANAVTMDLAYEFSYRILLHYVDVRCLWVTEITTTIGPNEFEYYLMALNLPRAHVEWLADYLGEAFEYIERLVNQLLDGYMPSATWDIWGVHKIPGYGISISNGGDFRIEQWARYQEEAGSDFARRYPHDTLRGIQ